MREIGCAFRLLVEFERQCPGAERRANIEKPGSWAGTIPSPGGPFNGYQLTNQVSLLGSSTPNNFCFGKCLATSGQ